MRTYSALFLAPLLLAQAPRNLTGNITDYNGAAIPGARVTATPATGTSSSASTDSEGLYRLNLTPGTYTVKIESPGFKTVESRVTVPSDRTGYFDSILEPAPLTEDIIVVTTTDSASSRPAYLVGSELAQGTIFTAYGKFPEGGNLRVRITDSSKALRELPLFYRSPGQLAGYVPSETAAGSGIVELLPDIGPISKLPIRIVDSRPTFFTLDQSGSGGGIFTDTNFAVISRANPARPGGFYTAWVNNAGKVDNDTAPTIRNRFFADYDFRVHNRSLAKSEVFYFGPSGIRGLDQMNFRVPPDFTGFGCGVPVQVGVKTEADKPFVWSNEVTIPVAASGACGDRFGFAAEDRAALAGAGIGNMEVAIGEVTIVTSNTAQAHRTTGRLTGYLWTDNVYRPVPDESCDYRWQPQGAGPSLGRPFEFAGTTTMTVPWGQFALSPTSNAGPYLLTFGAPASFTTGNYSVNFAPGFTVGGQAFNLQLSGQYTRPAGQAREFVAGRIANVQPEQRFQDWTRSLLGTVREMPGALRSQVNTDLNMQINHGTLGTHSIRCIGDTAGDLGFIDKALESYVPLLPATANTNNVSLRFFPKDRIRFPGTGPVNRIQVTFEGSLQFQDIGLRFR